MKPYLGNLIIQIANGDVSIGDIPHSLPLNNVFHVPRLTSSLRFVDQLVDDIYIIVFLGKASSIYHHQCSYLYC